MSEWRLPGLLTDYIVIHHRDRASSNLPEADVWNWEHLVDQWLRDPSCRGILIEIFNRLGGTTSFRSLREGGSTSDLRQRFVEALESKDLLVLDGRVAFTMPAAAQQEATRTQKQEARVERPPPRAAPKTWIAIKLRDESGAPVPNERYRITLADFSTREGRLNDKGEARVEGIDAGEAEITFPDADGSEWRAA